MNKNAIKKFATEARRELISRVGQRALKYGISDKEVGNPNDDSVNGHLLSSTERKQRAALITQIKEKGYEQVMEEVAYTWFNRFSALRFMEVNGYLPSRVRVFTDESNAFKPQILTEAIHLELDGLDMEKVYAYKETNDNDELYKYLLITQCNALNSVLPGMFQKISDYTELLFPDHLLRDGSVIQQMIELIPEEDWQDQVQIIGWLYQYYNSEKKDDVFAALKKNVKITKENIPAATQLFTPDWIVRYMVENSLGRLWVEGHPNDELKSQWKYYLEEAEQEPEVEAKLEEIRKEYTGLNPEDIKCIDPCQGSGHILAYMFDVLVQIYEAHGVQTRDAVKSIVENNIYGLDIDERAAQLAYFSVMMKGRQYDSRFFRRGVQPHVYAIVESNHVDEFAVEYFCNGDEKLKAAMDTIVSEMQDAKEYGSIITVSEQDWSALYGRLAEVEEEVSMHREAVLNTIKPLIQVAEVLAQKYDAVVTNPPYMGASGMSAKLSDFVKKNYPDSKSDLFSCFMERADAFVKNNRYTSLITMESWMFLSSFEKLRNKVNLNKTIINMVHMPYLGKGGTSLGINFGTATVIMKKGHIPNYAAQYEYTVYYECDAEGVPFTFPTINERWKTATQENFSKIPGSPVAYWVSENLAAPYNRGEKLFGEIASPCAGLATGDNNIFQRIWHEVAFTNIGFDVTDVSETKTRSEKWYPCNSGGEFRKWSTDDFIVVNWKNDGTEIKAFRNSNGKLAARPQNTKWYFKEGLTWNKLSSSRFAVKYKRPSFVFDDTSRSAFPTDGEHLRFIIGLMCSNVTFEYLKVLNPTMSFTNGDLVRIPVKMESKQQCNIDTLVDGCISLSRSDWDAYETSWDFKRHPLLQYAAWTPQMIAQEAANGYLVINGIADAYRHWKQECDECFNQLKANEEELNRIFIDIYGLQDELTPDVADKDVTVHRIYDNKDDVPESMKNSNYVRTMRDEIVSLISYAVGCMFGRYSLDVEGLAYAGGEWDSSKYETFQADKDNIIPICDDEYFDDDIVGRFVEFVKVVYGAETLEENLKFIADALGGKGQPREVIRNYFINDFYKDHCKTYQKRPIYWLFDSGKKNGFKCLIYMHRYQPDTIARIRTDYVHEQQSRYRTAIADLEKRIANASTSERVKLNKQLKTLNDQATEIHEYEEKIHHLADRMISIDLDDGVKVNYAKFQDVLAKIK